MHVQALPQHSIGSRAWPGHGFAADSLMTLLQALAMCAEMRPPVDISVGGDDSEEGVGVGSARTEFRSAVAV